jgi:Tfp pilus assembly pilus retraction ATPase PilT
MATKTTRVYPEDDQRAHMLATLHHESAPDFYHRVLDFWVENNREEANQLFSRVQRAVLSNDREQLRAVFREGVANRVDEAVDYIDRVGRE